MPIKKDATELAVGCPSNLKNHGSVDAKLEYFDNKRLLVTHPALERAVDALVWRSRAHNDQNLVLFVGPSGVGKSTALQLAQARLNKGIDLSVDLSSIPAVYYEVLASEERGFDYRGMYLGILSLCGEFAAASSLEMTSRAAGSKMIITVDPPAAGIYSVSLAALRARIQNSFERRGTRLLGFDEAVNLLLVTNFRSRSDRKDKLRRRANVVRSLVNGLSTRIVLAGAYDFLDLAFQGSQLARRSNVLPFYEYDLTPKGVEEFAVGWIGLLAHLPSEYRQLNAVAFAVEVMKESLGCVGIAKNILSQTLSSALEHQQVITPELVRRHYFPARALAQMRKEMIEGRAAIKSFYEDASFDSDDLSVDFPIVRQRGDAPKKKTRVGQFKPRRHFVEPA